MFQVTTLLLSHFLSTSSSVPIPFHQPISTKSPAASPPSATGSVSTSEFSRSRVTKANELHNGTTSESNKNRASVKLEVSVSKSYINMTRESQQQPESNVGEGVLCPFSFKWSKSKNFTIPAGWWEAELDAHVPCTEKRDGECVEVTHEALIIEKRMHQHNRTASPPKLQRYKAKFHKVTIGFRCHKGWIFSRCPAVAAHQRSRDLSSKAVICPACTYMSVYVLRNVHMCGISRTVHASRQLISPHACVKPELWHEHCRYKKNVDMKINALETS